MKIRTSKRLSFTLLEILVGLSLLLIAASVVGWRLHGLVEQRRFSSDIEQLKSRLFTLYCLAHSMEADWEGCLERKGDIWIFEASCIDAPAMRSVAKLSLHSFALFVNGKKAESFRIELFASGAVRPHGKLLFCQDPERPEIGSREIRLPELFKSASGDGVKNLGPMHPREVLST